METGRKKMKIKSLLDNEADLDKAIGGYDATRGERMR